MKKKKQLFFPVSGTAPFSKPKGSESPVENAAPCPCCGYWTIPNHGDALAYICPVCCWEIDLFLKSEQEPSDQNHGITLAEARTNYAAFGASFPGLKQYCRPPREYELPKK